MNEKYYSHCCGAYMPDYPDSDFCLTCHEHCCGINQEEMEAEEGKEKARKDFEEDMGASYQGEQE